MALYEGGYDLSPQVDEGPWSGCAHDEGPRVIPNEPQPPAPDWARQEPPR